MAIEDKFDVIDEGDVNETVDLFQEEAETEQFEGHETIYDGGPTYDQIQDWKSRYNDEVYMSDFGENVFIWRPIRRKEFRNINQVEGLKDEYYIEESICRACVIWPENYAQQSMAFGKAGIPTMLSNLILENSGFRRPTTLKV